MVVPTSLGNISLDAKVLFDKITEDDGFKKAHLTVNVNPQLISSGEFYMGEEVSLAFDNINISSVAKIELDVVSRDFITYKNETNIRCNPSWSKDEEINAQDVCIFKLCPCPRSLDDAENAKSGR
ncbi:MAG: hypothetical protein FWH27_17565 [Planctomycetaceae bacterium]|nr:hypothetical protein [Planctomycetaceae bacterium]